MHSLNHASAALIFLVFATSASASVVTLNYTSGSNGVFEQNGLITIDESLYPGGSVNGTTLSIQIVAFAGASSSLINRATYGVFGAASGSGTLIHTPAMLRALLTSFWQQKVRCRPSLVFPQYLVKRMNLRYDLTRREMSSVGAGSIFKGMLLTTCLPKQAFQTASWKLVRPAVGRVIQQQFLFPQACRCS